MCTASLRCMRTGSSPPAEAVAALTAMVEQPQTYPGQYEQIGGVGDIREVMRAFYTARQPEDSRDPVISDPYVDAFGAGVFSSNAHLLVSYLQSCT